uniref:TATA element modulatory factor 1 putative n=1 Tax=Albugo laibachii Nc14 TaxID=890382 RepID=F0WL53_9STRA|nr:TATA element modulatory factor 1 putative [Albugo laibachii Nc14]|eukprot:CCA22014.1 TATA element modulatory factor 1 putative [Albugo laibachii Nc14]
MSWSQQWNSRINVTSLVSLGMEQVAKLKEDVEKQFDHLVISEVDSSSSKRDESDHVNAQQAPNPPTDDIASEEILQALDTLNEEIGGNDNEEKDAAFVEVEAESCEEIIGSLDTFNDPVTAHHDSLQDIEAIKSKKVGENEEVEENDEAEESIKLEESKEALESKEVEDLDKNESDTDEVISQKNEIEVDSVEEYTISKLREEVLVLEKQLITANESIAKLHAALDTTCHREVTAVERNQKLAKEIEQLKNEKSKWKRREDEGKKTSQQIELLQQALTSKDAQLQSLLEEGNALSIKQGQIEQRIRRIRREKDEQNEAYKQLQTKAQKTDELLIDSNARFASIQEENTTLKATIEQYQFDLNTRSQLIERLEGSLEGTRQELQIHKQQIEHLQREKTSLEVEREVDLKLKGESDSFERVRIQLEQNLCILEQKCEDLEQENLRREHNARSEIMNLKQKWQKALRQVDSMNATITEATQPLHRQIRALQEEQRTRRKAWDLTENKLHQSLDAECKRNDEVQNAYDLLKLRINALESENASLRASLMQEKEALKSAKEKLHLKVSDQNSRKEAAAGEKLYELSQQVFSLQKQLQLKQAECEETSEQQKLIIEKLTKELKDAQAAQQAKEAELALLRLELNHLSGSKHLQADTDGLSTKHNHESSHDLQVDHGQRAKVDLGNSPAYVFDLSHLKQTLRLRDGENQLLKHQLSNLKGKQKELTEQLIRLTSQNATLQSENQQTHKIVNQKQKLEARYQLLLELFGEKEEEIEELQAKVTQIHELYEKSKASDDSPT